MRILLLKSVVVLYYDTLLQFSTVHVHMLSVNSLVLTFLVCWHFASMAHYLNLQFDATEKATGPIAAAPLHA